MSAQIDELLSNDACAREPIHIPGGIQPHGAMLIFGTASRELIQYSANAKHFIGRDVRSGENLSGLFGPDTHPDLHEWLEAPERPFMRRMNVGALPHYVHAHLTAQGLILEIERPTDADTREEVLGNEAVHQVVGKFIEHAQSYDGVDRLLAAAADEFRALTGINRVLIYRFDEEFNGEVLAESTDGVLPSYIGQHFPAGDIPPQARALYVSNRLRLIPSSLYRPVPLVPELSPVDGRPLDMSRCVLRSVSPVHLEYMQNMGTHASMSVSLVIDGKLWGLVSCHHSAPCIIDARARVGCELLGLVLSQQLAAIEREAYGVRRMHTKVHESAAIYALSNADTLDAGFHAAADHWLELAGAHGVALLHEGIVLRWGATPSPARIRDLIAKIKAHEAFTYVNDRLSLTWPEFSDIAEVASGVAAIAISDLSGDFVIWFRKEVARTMRWAGQPSKEPDVMGRLHPRKSFSEWREHVRGRAEPWLRADLHSVSDFKAALTELAVKRFEERARLSSQLLAVNKELESFSYYVSHDLRAPFRHILGYTQILQETCGETEEAVSQYAARIVNIAAHGGRLVDGLLAFAKLGRAEIKAATVDMNALVAEAWREFEIDTARRVIHWSCVDLPPAWGDTVLLRQVIENLLANAIKYTRQRSIASISVSGVRHGGTVRYSIVDNGVGFDNRYVDKLFGVFQRLHRDEEFEGSGIGLALVKRIVERHGGSVAAYGALGEGARFEFCLPSGG